MRLLGSVTAAATMIASSAAFKSTAGAYGRGSQVSDTCDLTTGKIGLVGPEWAAGGGAETLVGPLTGAASFWNGYLDNEGFPIVNMTGVATGESDINVKWAPLTGKPNVLAEANCDPNPTEPSPPEIRFNSTKLQMFVNDPNLFELTLTHELGHIFGLRHTGEYDSWLSTAAPVMDASISVAENTPGGSGTVGWVQDDAAQLAARHLSNGLTNAGIENGLFGWSVTGSPGGLLGTSSVARHGSLALSFTSSSTNSRFKQNIRISDIHSTFAEPNGADGIVPVEAWAWAKGSTGYSGHAWGQLQFRRLDDYEVAVPGSFEEKLSYDFLLDPFALNKPATGYTMWTSMPGVKITPTSNGWTKIDLMSVGAVTFVSGSATQRSYDFSVQYWLDSSSDSVRFDDFHLSLS